MITAEHLLCADDLAVLDGVARTLAARGDRIDDPCWVARARRAWEDTPAPLRRAVSDFRRHSGPDGRLVLSGLPIGDVPATPMVKGSVQHTPTVGAAVLALVAHGLGDPAAFAAEKSGALVQDVVPVPGEEKVQGNTGSVELTFHTENAFHQHRPDYVMLLCLRADHDGVAELRTFCIRTALAELSAATRAVLAKPDFLTAAPPSFGGNGEGSLHAVLTGDPADPDLCLDESATRPLTDEAATALADLRGAIARHHTGVRLRPGDLAVVDNRVTMHGRSEFVPRYDGADRWLQRTFAFADLRRSRDHRPGDSTVLEK
jgi:L-asparagine oxygenase